MLLLVQIDLSGADLGLFEKYETEVLALLKKYGAKLERRLRALDASSETHLLHFPDQNAFEAFRNDPARVALQDVWTASRARSTMREVTPID